MLGGWWCLQSACHRQACDSMGVGYAAALAVVKLPRSQCSKTWAPPSLIMIRAYGFYPQNVFGIKEPLKDNLDSILKSRDITSPAKVRLVKAMVFPIVTYGCESWIIKKAECQRIDAFELWCWRRLLRIPRTARRSNQSILKEISPGISLATSCEELTHWKSPAKRRRG